jgi:hypothetical protein
VLITTYRAADHRAFERRRPKNLFSVFTIVGDHTAPTVEGFRSVVFLREGADAALTVPAATQQARHAFFTAKKVERFRNCSRVSPHELTAPEPRRKRGYFVEEVAAPLERPYA